MWYKRSISTKIGLSASKFPVVVLTGARQSGKTELLKRLFPDHTYVSLDVPSVATMAVSAQQMDFEITPIYNYAWTSRVATWDGDFDIGNSGSWGVMLNVDIESYTYKGTALEILYNRQDSKAEFYEYGTRIKTDLFDMSVDYYQIGVANRLPVTP